MEPFIGQILVIIIVLAGFGMIFGGQKTAGKILKAPFAFAGKLVLDTVHGVLRFGLDLLGQGLRGAGRLLERGTRRIFRLPAHRPAPAPRRAPRREEQEDGDDEP